MSYNDYPANNFDKFKTVKRKALRLSAEETIKTGFLDPEERFCLVAEPALENVNLVTWAKSNLQLLEANLLKHGAILFRNFDVDSATQFQQFASTIAPDLLDYNERAAPRTQVMPGVFTSTEF